MDILLQTIGFCFIPLLAIFIYNGIKEIVSGLKEYYQFTDVTFSVVPFDGKIPRIIKSLSYRNLNVGYAKTN